ncbi:SBBP repeat-containing protein [Paraflavisolibacter sp. H34]|uniref:SBBP repeat-containing protein n=1 Tax=Huijunlia imazamoxiresistens TaxID=3127457 RepID=UPI00301A88D3
MRTTLLFRKVLLFIFLFPLPVFCLAQASREWVKRHNGTSSFSSDNAHAVAVDASGNVYVTGGIENSETGSDYTTIKHDKDGNILWKAKYNGSDSANDVAAAIAVDASGNVYVTGYSKGSATGYDYATIKYGSDGSQKWLARYSGPGNFPDEANAIAVDAAGNVYVAGFSTAGATNKDYVAIKYNAAGAQLWVKKYNGPGNLADEVTALAVDASGNVYVTGYSKGSAATDYDYATIKYTAAGVQQWLARYNGPANKPDYANALRVDASGNVYVTGYSAGSTSGGDYATVKYTAAGVQQWAARYNGPANISDEAIDLAADAAGNVYVTGYSKGANYTAEYATIKYNAAGVQQWAAKYNSSSLGFSFNMPSALSMDASGNVYVTGLSAVDDYLYSGDFATVKYNNAGVQQWVKRYNGPGNWYDAADALAVDGNGNVYVAGDSWGTGTGNDYATLKYNAAGTQLWAKRESGTGNGKENAAAIAGDASGNVWVTGSGSLKNDKYNEPAADYLTIWYNADGSRKWEKRYNGPADDDDQATALAADASGNVYVTGLSYGSATGYDYATIKYGNDGSQKWATRYSGSGNFPDEANAIAVDAAGNVYVTGSSESSATGKDFATIKYNAAGVQQWVKKYNGSANLPDEASALAVDASGNVYVTGYSKGSASDSDYVTIKYNAAGVQQWLARYNGPGNKLDFAHALRVDASGNVYVTGFSQGSTSGGDYATIKYNAAGVQQWVARYNGPGNKADEANALRVDASGNVYVTGLSQGSTSGGDYATIKYNAAGVQQWAARYNGPKNLSDGATDLALDASGNVYVTGFSQGSGMDNDYATIKYTAAGVQQWVDRYNSRGNGEDGAVALALDAKGNVYVTGVSEGPGTGEDYLTIKYAPFASSITSLDNKAGASEPMAGFRVAHYPNPVIATARLHYELPADGQLSIKLYDLQGREVASWISASAKAGTYTTGVDVSGLQKGSYYYRVVLKTQSKVWVQTQKITVIR